MKFIKFLLGLTTLTASTIGFAQNSSEKEWQQVYDAREAIYEKNIGKFSVHDKFHRTLVLSGFFFLKIASTFLNSSFFPKPIKRRIAI